MWNIPNFSKKPPVFRVAFLQMNLYTNNLIKKEEKERKYGGIYQGKLRSFKPTY